MGTALISAEDEKDSYTSFLRRVYSKSAQINPSEEMKHMLTGNSNSLTLLKREKEGRAKLSVSEKRSSDSGNENPPSAPEKTQANIKEEEKPNLLKESEPPFLSSFLIELVHTIKNGLLSISGTGLNAIEKLEDGEFKNRSQISMRDDIRKIDSVLNALLNYIHINTPIVKTNTVYLILEEILEASEKQLAEKNLRVYKKFDKELPETYIHNEQVRFILHSILQYILFTIPRNETIAILVKSSADQNGPAEKKAKPDQNRAGIELIFGFNSEKRPNSSLEKNRGSREEEHEETLDLILRLVKEVLEKNHGMIQCESNGTKPNSIITVKFPIERRKMVYYEPINV